MKKRILMSDRIRHTDGRFSFIPHRFLADGFLKSLTRKELTLYLFLTLASDNNGISYYGQKSICTHLHLEKEDYLKVRNNLIERDLIAFDGVFFQVLQLPQKPIKLHHISREQLTTICQNISKGGSI